MTKTGMSLLLGALLCLFVGAMALLQLEYSRQSVTLVKRYFKMDESTPVDRASIERWIAASEEGVPRSLQSASRLIILFSLVAVAALVGLAVVFEKLQRTRMRAADAEEKLEAEFERRYTPNQPHEME